MAPGRRLATNDRYKRPFDLAVVAMALLLLAPFWLLLGVAIALAIRLEDRGPVLYRQTRLGRGGRPFVIVKFRTMVVGAEDGTGPVRAARRDARVTAVGRLLRRFHLDELPQVVNVLKGEMSLVGPRPERPALAVRFEQEAPGFTQRLRVRPGVMGLAQASNSYHWTPRRKLLYDNLYIVEITEPGPPEALQIGSRPVPAAGSGEVLIRVAAAGLNRADVMQRKGSYPPPPGASDVLGLEVSGTVAAVGAGVADLAVGDEVCALLTGGGYAEYCLAPAPQCLPIPAGVSLIDAAALPEAYATVWTNVMDRGRLADGETLLGHGGSSGIGTVAIQLARLFGARIFATAGTPAKCATCVELGAERAIDYRAEDFVAALHEATGGRGVDLILDMVGGVYLQRNVASLAVEGRLVIIALMEGAQAELDLARLMARRLTVTGATLRARSIEQKAEIMTALRARVWPRFASDELRPIVHATYPLAAAAEAHRVMESSVHIGKLLLVP